MANWEYVIIEQCIGTINPGTYQIWEGKRTKLGDPAIWTVQGVFSKLGELGWEMVTSYARTESQVEYVLKRELK